MNYFAKSELIFSYTQLDFRSVKRVCDSIFPTKSYVANKTDPQAPSQLKTKWFWYPVSGKTIKILFSIDKLSIRLPDWTNRRTYGLSWKLLM